MPQTLMTSRSRQAEKFPSQSARMTVDGPARRAVAPHFAQQFFAREHAVRVVGESDQQLVFLGGELDGVSSDADVAGAEVDRERRDAELPLVASAFGAAQNGCHARAELWV